MLTCVPPGALQALSGLQALCDLELLGNPVSKVPDYRAHLLHRLPQLQLLDGQRTGLPEHAPCVSTAARVMAPEMLAGDVCDAGDEVRGEACSAVTELRAQASQPSVQASCGGRSDAVDRGGQHTDNHTPAAASWLTSNSTVASLRRPHSAASNQHKAVSMLSAWRPSTATPHIQPTAGTDPHGGWSFSGGGGVGGGGGREGGATRLIHSNVCLNDSPVVLEYLARHALTQGDQLVGRSIHLCTALHNDMTSPAQCCIRLLLHA